MSLNVFLGQIQVKLATSRTGNDYEVDTLKTFVFIRQKAKSQTENMVLDCCVGPSYITAEGKHGRLFSRL